MSFCPQCRSKYPDDWRRCPKDESELLASQYIGKYEVQEPIGTGGMGAVYRARNPDTRSIVAIKLMHAEMSEYKESRARFQREAATVAALRTRHCVSIYDFGNTDDGTMFLVMEYLSGHALRQEIVSPPATLQLARLNMIFEGALRGLGAAHKAKITHRDLKPENIFIADTDDGEVAKILDFGIARVESNEALSALTHEGALMGTPAYMAPEQVSGKRGSVGPWTDVYAMGVILYEMLSGVTPFHADSVTAVLSRVLAREFMPLGDVRPGLPQAVLDVVGQAMSENHSARFVDANAFLAAWRNAYRTLPSEIRDQPVASSAQRGTGQAKVDAHSDTALGATSPPTAAAMPPQSRASAATSNHNTSMTPGPVVIDQPATATASGKGRIVASVAALAVGGAVAAFFVLGGGTTPEETPSAGPLLADAAAAPPTVTDAAPPPPPKIPKDMARLAGGRFQMGVDPRRFRGKPGLDKLHQVQVNAFLLDKTEMTIATYKRAAGALPTKVTDAPEQPVRQITWSEASAACRALGKRLPSEEEWEFAATRHRLDAKRARLKTKGVTGPSAVASHEGDCTPEGVCDLLGNVTEWTASLWRTGTTKNAKFRVIRGGSYAVSANDRFWASPHARSKAKPTTRDPEIGFRCARDLD